MNEAFQKKKNEMECSKNIKPFYSSTIVIIKNLKIRWRIGVGSEWENPISTI